MKFILKTLATVMLISNIPALAMSQTAGIYAVTITNLTHGQAFTPILVLSHLKDFTIFTAGSAPSAALSLLAEDGDIAPMAFVLQSSDAVFDIQNSEGLLEPGESVTVNIMGNEIYSRISSVAMLIPTNDAFFAMQGIKLPKGNKTRIATAVAYDAGSEPNDESCESIPGLTCGGEGASPNAGGEGFIHVHAGIHGIGDLVASDQDWRNPVARITIARVSDERADAKRAGK